jgi:hypothetical protein
MNLFTAHTNKLQLTIACPMELLQSAHLVSQLPAQIKLSPLLSAPISPKSQFFGTAWHGLTVTLAQELMQAGMLLVSATIAITGEEWYYAAQPVQQDVLQLV